MFKEGDWVKPTDSMIRIAGIDVKNIKDMQVVEVYSYHNEVECFIRTTNGQSLRATFMAEYVTLTSEKEEYSLTF